MKIVDIKQGTEEWFEIRAGIPTASSFDKVITSSGDKSKQIKKYCFQLVGEKLSGKKEEGYANSAMERGIIMEEEVRNLYELVTINLNEQKVYEVGFCLDDEMKFGCSPDALIGEDGGLEIKCPGMANHVQYLYEGKLPTSYYQQVQGSLLVTGREWWDFMSYYPGLEPFMIRVYPDLEFQKKLKKILDELHDEIRSIMLKLKKRGE